jgi:hypothetical protein
MQGFQEITEEDARSYVETLQELGSFRHTRVVNGDVSKDTYLTKRLHSEIVRVTARGRYVVMLKVQARRDGRA